MARLYRTSSILAAWSIGIVAANQIIARQITISLEKDTKPARGVVWGGTGKGLIAQLPGEARIFIGSIYIQHFLEEIWEIVDF